MSNCHCGSGKPFSECCEPVLNGAPAPTAEALMRSRYSAYAVKNMEHLEKSLIESKRGDFDVEAAEKWAEDSTWQGLEVIETVGGGENDDTGEVEFVARFMTGSGVNQHHHERASFTKVDGRWLYSNGKVMGGVPFRRETPKVGRNEPCPCGSGKKFKKCCG